MTLLALANVLLDAPVRRRFHAEPMVQATAYLLEERLPALLDIVEEEEVARSARGRWGWEMGDRAVPKRAAPSAPGLR